MLVIKGQPYLFLPERERESDRDRIFYGKARKIFIKTLLVLGLSKNVLNT